MPDVNEADTQWCSDTPSPAPVRLLGPYDTLMGMGQKEMAGGGVGDGCGVVFLT